LEVGGGEDLTEVVEDLCVWVRCTGEAICDFGLSGVHGGEADPMVIVDVYNLKALCRKDWEPEAIFGKKSGGGLEASE